MSLILLVCAHSPDVFSAVILSWHLGDAANTMQNDAQQFITETVAVAAQSSIGKAIKDRIDKFSEGMPILMNALDELKAVHPFIAGELIQLE